MQFTYRQPKKANVILYQNWEYQNKSQRLDNVQYDILKQVILTHVLFCFSLVLHIIFKLFFNETK